MNAVPSERNVNRIAASIEITARHALESADLPQLFPKGVRVYVPDVGTDELKALVGAARRLRDCGYIPVPHFAARRLTTRSALEARVRAMAEESGVDDVLVIAGSVRRAQGEFPSTLDVLETGLLDKYGIRHIAVAGHPEGSPDFSQDVAKHALAAKRQFAERTNARMRIVTQFGFDSDKFIKWAEDLRRDGIDLPVHLGVAGPARLTTLIKYAALCGVGNSITFLKKQAHSLTALATNQSPEKMVTPIEQHVNSHPGSGITQIHVYPFGGMKKSAEWLESRGSWSRTAWAGSAINAASR